MASRVCACVLFWIYNINNADKTWLKRSTSFVLTFRRAIRQQQQQHYKTAAATALAQSWETDKSPIQK